MEPKEISLKIRQRRKFLLVLPALVLPFLLIIFIALGGGKGTRNDHSQVAGSQGFNFRLPDPHFAAGRESDKLSLYERMDRDSSRLSLTHRSAAWAIHPADSSLLLEATRQNKSERHVGRAYDTAWPGDNGAQNSKTSMNAREQQVMEKLAALRAVMNEKKQPAAAAFPLQTPVVSRSIPHTGQDRQEIADDELGNGTDPELTQLDGMLDKIRSIQHPELVADSIARGRKKNSAVFTVSKVTAGTEPMAMGSARSSLSHFFSSEISDTNRLDQEAAIGVFVPETQTVVSGSTIRLQTIDDALVDGVLISKNQWIYGMASLHGERLQVQFTSIRAGERILPIALEAFDLDGLAGIYIPGSMNRDIAKQSTDQGLGAIGLTGLDPSVAAQATAAGIQTARTLVSRKVRLIRVTLPSGYRLLLKPAAEK